MKVITAPEHYVLKEDEIGVFLAGGICNCEEWQDEVIKNLDEKTSGVNSTDKLVVFNPRRKNFPIGDKRAAYEQIKWEFDNLMRCDIFSMYFCGGESDQPICMYELGRYISQMQIRFPSDWEHRITISVEEGYKRKQDVAIQTQLACGNRYILNTFETDNNILRRDHANYIYAQYLEAVINEQRI